VVFDFDWSLVNENSDTWVVERLAPALEPRLRIAEEGNWTKTMDGVLAEMTGPRGVTRHQLDAALASLPVDPAMLEAARHAAAAPGTELRILSDANTHFITTILARHGLAALFPVVCTNPSRWEAGGVLRVGPHDDPSLPRCPRCPPNLCKGRVLQGWLREGDYDAVVYVGDGAGDYCPATRLRPTDVLCCREQYGCHRRILREPATVQARVVPWANGGDVLRCLQDVLT